MTTRAQSPRFCRVHGVFIALALIAAWSIGTEITSPAAAMMGADPGDFGIKRLEDADHRKPRGRAGTWIAEERGERVHLSLTNERGRSQFGSTFERNELDGFDALGSGRFELRRDAGTFTFVDDPALSNRSGARSGRFAFALDEGFVKDMAARGFDAGRARREAATMALLDVSRSYMDSMVSLGYDESLDKLIEMRIHGVSEQFVRELEGLGYEDLSASRLVELRVHGVTPDFIRELESLGYEGMSTRRLVELRIHGVTTESIRERMASGDSLPDLDRLVEFQIHGVTPEFAAEMAELGYDRLDEDDLVAFRIHGVSPGFVEELAAMGYSGVDADELLSFRIHGVTPDLIRELADAGYSNLDEDELVSFRIHGVTPDLIGRLADRGVTGLSPDELVDIKIHGLDRSLTRE